MEVSSNRIRAFRHSLVFAGLLEIYHRGYPGDYGLKYFLTDRYFPVCDSSELSSRLVAKLFIQLVLVMVQPQSCL